MARLNSTSPTRPYLIFDASRDGLQLFHFLAYSNLTPTQSQSSFNFGLYSFHPKKRYHSDCFVTLYKPLTTNLFPSQNSPRQTYTTKRLERCREAIKYRFTEDESWWNLGVQYIAEETHWEWIRLSILFLKLSHFVQILGLTLRSVWKFIKYGEGIELASWNREPSSLQSNMAENVNPNESVFLIIRYAPFYPGNNTCNKCFRSSFHLSMGSVR